MFDNFNGSGAEENDTQENTLTRDDVKGLVILGMVLLCLAIVASTSGFGPYDEVAAAARPPTLWDWMGLLIVPIALALGAIWFNKAQKDLELRLANEARLEDRRIAEDRQRQAILDSYLDRMADLLLKHIYPSELSDPSARSIARARTQTVLRGLDGDRKAHVLIFLAESGLISGEEPFIHLDGADLGGANLNGIFLPNTNFEGVSMRGANLRRATFSRAVLRRVDLNEADMTGAFLNAANLELADLEKALLISANMERSVLQVARLIGANMQRAQLVRANMQVAILDDANLYRAKLIEADMQHARLRRVNLSRANMNSVKIEHADLEEAVLERTDLRLLNGWTFYQLEQAATLDGAVMPDGVRLGHPGNEELGIAPIEGDTYEDWKKRYRDEHPEQY